MNHESSYCTWCLLPGKGCCGCTCHRWCSLNDQSWPWWCKTCQISPHLFPGHSIQTWRTPYRSPVAPGAQMEACSPNTEDDSSPARLGGETTCRARGCKWSHYRTLVSWFRFEEFFWFSNNSPCQETVVRATAMLKSYYILTNVC